MSPADVLRRASAASGSLGAIVFAALVPKCPLCVAAMLSALGVGAASAQRLAPMVRVSAFGLAAAVVIALAWPLYRRARRPCCASK